MNRRIDITPSLTFGQRVRNRTAALLASLIIAAVNSDATVIDDFSGPIKWTGTNDLTGSGLISFGIVDQQLLISADFKDPMNPGFPLNTFGNVYYSRNLPMRQRQTLELRADLVSANQDNVLALLVTMSASGGEYVFGKSQKEILLLKWSQKDGFSVAFWESLDIKNQDVVMVLALTPLGERLLVETKILDKATQRVLFERRLQDGPESDWTVPSPVPYGWKIFNPDVGRPYPDDLVVVGLGMHHLTEGQQGRVDLRLDNLEYDTYESPYLGYERAVYLSWPENGTEEQIVVVADSLTNPVWTPCLEPMFKRGGKLCVAVPTTPTEQYFKLVPGTQFRDDFSDSQGPWGCRYGYHGVFQDGGKSYEIANGVLRVHTTGPWNGGFAIEPPPELGVAVRDFHAAVDVLSATTATNTWCTVGICARGEYDEPKVEASTCIGGIILNSGSVLGNVRLYMYDNVTEHKGPAFNFNPGESYRIEFSGVGPRLTLRVWNKTTGLLEGEMSVSDTKLTPGSVAFWLNAPPEGRQEITLDNFFVTGTKP
jgi:hypothetical protein